MAELQSCNMSKLRIAAGCQSPEIPGSNAPIAAVPSSSASTQNSTPESPQFIFKIDEQTAHEIRYGREGNCRDCDLQHRPAACHHCGRIMRGGHHPVLCVLGMSIRPSKPLESTHGACRGGPTRTPKRGSQRNYCPFPHSRADCHSTTDGHSLPDPGPICQCPAPGRFLHDFERLGPDTTMTNYTLEYKNNAYHVVVGEQNGGQSVWVGDNYQQCERGSGCKPDRRPG